MQLFSSKALRSSVKAPKFSLLPLLLLTLLSACGEDTPEAPAQESTAPSVIALDPMQRAQQETQSTIQVMRNESAALEREIAAAEQRSSELHDQIATIEQTIENQDQQIASLEASYAFIPRINSWAHSSIEPFLGAQWAGTLIAAELVALAIFGFLWVRLKRKDVIDRHGKKLLIFAVVLGGMYFSNHLAAQENSEQATVVPELSEAEQARAKRSLNFQRSLDASIELLTASDAQRAIKILQDKNDRGRTHLPLVETSNKYLKPQQVVTGLGVEYHYTLAALHEHNQDRGKAVETIGRLYELKRKQYSGNDARLLALATVFLLENREHSLVTDNVPNLRRRIRDFDSALVLANTLHKWQFYVQANQFYEIAVELSQDPDKLIELADAQIRTGSVDSVHKSLERAIYRSATGEQVSKAMARAVDQQLTEVTNKAIDKLVEIFQIQSDTFLSDFETRYKYLIDKSSAGAAQRLFNQSVSKAMRYRASTRNPVVLGLAKIAIKHENVEHARNAVSELDARLSNRSFVTAAPALGVAEREVMVSEENAESIAVRTLLATLNEAMSHTRDADLAYTDTVLHALQSIVQNYGKTGDQWSNDFFLARDAVSRAEGNLAAEKLDKIYKILELARTDALQLEHAALKAKLEQQHAEQGALLEQLQLRRDELAAQSDKSLLITTLGLRNLAELVVILFGLFIAAYFANSYRKRFQSFQLFAFVGKFWECIAWMQVFTIIGLPIGLLQVLSAQTMLLFHRLAAEGERIHPVQDNVEQQGN